MQADAYNALLEQIPHPGLIIASDTRLILAVNTKISELSGYASADLIGLDVRIILPEYTPSSSESVPHVALSNNGLSSNPGEICDILDRTNTRTSMSVRSIRFSNRDKRLLLVLEPQNSRSASFPCGTGDLFWNSLDRLATAGQNLDCHSAIQQVMVTCQQLTGAEQIVVYMMAEHAPILDLQFCYPDPTSFPTQLSTQELSSLGTPNWWKPGRRAENTLQKFARHARYAYLASAPLGEAHAVIGLLALAGHDPNPDMMLELTRFISVVLTTILEQHSWRDHAEKELSSLRARINSAKTIEERISDGLILLAPDLKIQRMNMAAETILGYNHREVLGQAVTKILIGAESLQQALENAQNSSATFRLGSTVRLFRRNGEPFQAVLRIFPVILNKQVDEILILLQDLSEQEFIRKQAQQLEQRAFLGEVTATFAHEIRNPVHNISTGLQYMAINLPKNDPNQQSIDLMLQDCDRLAELIKAVLAFSKPIDYEMENVDITTMLQQLMERNHARITRANVRYDLQIAADCPPVMGNMRALEQVINNLVVNALQAMQATGGRLVIKAQATSSSEGREYVEISVADTGPGIPKENQERIFQPFFTTEQNGTGLGLAVAKRILTAHKGAIRVTSFPGGTVFHIQLPASKS